MILQIRWAALSRPGESIYQALHMPRPRDVGNKIEQIEFSFLGRGLQVLDKAFQMSRPVCYAKEDLDAEQNTWTHKSGLHQQ